MECHLDFEDHRLQKVVSNRFVAFRKNEGVSELKEILSKLDNLLANAQPKKSSGSSQKIDELQIKATDL